MIFDAIRNFFEKLFGTSSGGAKSMAGIKKPKIIEVDVSVKLLTGKDPQLPDSYSFELKNHAANKMKFKNDRHPGFIIMFNIDDPGNTGCQFLPDPDDAMWVQPSGLPNPPCPSSPAYWDQFRAIDVVRNQADQENRGLIVSNRNDYKQMFAFTLRFEIPNCNKVVEFDPIGDNENGDQ